jgi:hypothetical protein
MMSDARREIIAEKAWLSRAKVIRSEMESELVMFSYHQFFDRKNTLLFGKRFWEKVDTVEYDDPNNITAIFDLLKSQNVDDSIYWLHSNTNDAGMLCIKLHDYIVSITSSKQVFEKDILFSDQNLQYGICYEIGENGSWLRHWGITS